MRVLLDGSLPRQLEVALVGFEATTVQAQGWSGLRNGKLLKQAAAPGFKVFLTSDQGLEFQRTD